MLREYQYEDDGELILVMSEIRQRETELNITKDEWLGRMKKRKKIDSHKLQAHCNVVKKGRNTVIKDFKDVFQVVRIEEKRLKSSAVH